MPHTQYRLDIDGLRAVAVIAVLIHHLNPGLLPGGFVGVDIFFVISGFLITSQVFSEIRQNTFSLKRFYQRRINRIVPALATVSLASVIAGAFILSPADLTRLNVSALLSLLGVSNIYIWVKYGNYFAADASEAPLLHTWSLGIEEQFYVIWPLLILALYRLAPRYVLAVLGVGIVAAIGLSEYATNVFATASYYLLPTRFFELMLGGALGIYLYRPCSLGQRAAQGSALVGAGLIGFSLFALSPDAPFPGLNALMPCLGAALLILAGSGSVRSRLLTNRPMVFIGLISYSLYLWHWPLIAYLNYLGIAMTFTVGTALLVVSISLSWWSWRYVEIPFRRSGVQLPFSRVLTQRFMTPTLGLAVLAALSLQLNGFPQRFAPEVSTLEAMTLVEPNKLRSDCHMPNARYGSDPNPKCRLGARKEQLDGIMVGDSFANHFTGMVDILAAPDGIRLMDYTLDACPPIFGYTAEVSTAYGARCAGRNKRVFELINQHHYPYVVLAGAWPKDTAAGAIVEASIKAVADNTGQVIVILSNQNIDKAATCPVRRLMFGSDRPCSAPLDITAPYWEGIRARLTQVRFIDPNQVICPAGLCSPIIDGQLLYRDDAHLNDVGSRFIGRTLRDRGFSLLHDPAHPGPIATTR
ncbi:acyltransferase family protein [Pseudomonas viciae]|uniref:Acyltransferase n=1 Tax=Pseudomonas viciae TaxID=2505979 RepID=A0A4P7PJ11_9PSED|nr:acyltransferase family protein [Pseudomonas viciae]QBZ90739.1 acyltransferase [Pseudomonas viciae]UZE84724.1 acyltransferase [Pseudomonas viciae]WGO91636.1 acyltransferase family protein [Pseudomonas viciae]